MRKPKSAKRGLPIYMTPADFAAAIVKLNLTEDEAADTFRLRSSRSIRHYKHGDRRIDGPLSLAVELMLEKNAR